MHKAIVVQVIFLLLFRSEPLIVGPLDLFLRLHMDDVQLRQKDREGMLSLHDMHKGELIPVFIDGIGLLAILVNLLVQVEDTVMGSKYRDAPALLLTEHREHHRIHAMIGLAIQGLRPCQLPLGKPWLLPFGLGGLLNLVNQHFRIEIEGLVFHLLG